MKIEKNIPIPPIQHSRRKIRDILRDMEVGDSIKIEHGQLPYIHKIMISEGMKCTTRAIDKKSRRVWRIA